VTVTEDVPVLVSLEAVIVALPAATPVTSPAAVTVAAAVLLDDQVMLRPVNTLPPASLVTAESWTVAPVWTLGAEGETATVATGIGGGAVTVKPPLPFLPSLDAVIVVVPGATPEIAPLVEIVATPVFELCQSTLRPERTFPPASFRVAVAWAV
jgi:hypothetical protein